MTISALATAGGTLVLAGTTYASVRSANRAARVAERALLADLRPLLVESSESDAPLHVNFYDRSGITVPGGGAAVELVEGRLYIVLSLRNVGPGIAVLHGGYVYPERRVASVDHAPVADFRMLTRDIFVPSGKVGFWQIAFRRDEDPAPRELLHAVEAGAFTTEVLYGDYEGGQRVITRFGVLRAENGAWQLATIRHWQLDRAAPR